MKSLVNRLTLLGTGGRLFDAIPLSASATPPTVTVVIPCYKYGHYLDRCVSAVLEQPGIQADVIIVDDCSPDDSAAVAEKIAAADGRVSVIRHPVNKGHIATYNDGLAAVTGEFVALVSADDIVTPGALSRAVALMTARPSVGFVYGHAVHFTNSPPPVRTEPEGWSIWTGEAWVASRCRSGYSVIASPEVVMRTSVMRKIGGYKPELPHSGDFEMWMRAASVADVGYIVGADQALYRQHETNMHKSMFKSGNYEGQLIDLQQRWLSFQTVFAGFGADLPHRSKLEATARRTIASQALDHINYAYARGFSDFPIGEFEDFARSVDPSVSRSSAGRALNRRKSRGMTSRPIHPLWAPRAGALRFAESARRWRRRRIGV